MSTTEDGDPALAFHLGIVVGMLAYLVLFGLASPA